MVRTKRVKASQKWRGRSTVTRSSTASSVGLCDSDGFAIPAPVEPTFCNMKDELSSQYDLYLSQYKRAYANQRALIKRAFNAAKVQLGSYLNSTIGELQSAPANSTVSSTLSSSAMKDRTNTLSKKPVVEKPIKTRSSTRVQQQKPSIPVAPASTNKFVTPMNQRPIPIAVTPKVNMETPISVYRRPRLGEFAMSADGSPLMVSSIPQDDFPTITLPLRDGRVLSILPNSGVVADQLPLLDDDLRIQLETLQNNLKIITGAK